MIITYVQQANGDWWRIETRPDGTEALREYRPAQRVSTEADAIRLRDYKDDIIVQTIVVNGISFVNGVAPLPPPDPRAISDPTWKQRAQAAWALDESTTAAQVKKTLELTKVMLVALRMRDPT